VPSIPKKCPVCGSHKLKKYNLAIEVEHRNPPARQSYRCNKGHVFFVEKASAATKG
jgi:transposase-like protein